MQVAAASSAPIRRATKKPPIRRPEAWQFGRCLFPDLSALEAAEVPARLAGVRFGLPVVVPGIDGMVVFSTRAQIT